MKKRLINLRVILFGTLLSMTNNVLFGQNLTPYVQPSSAQEQCGAAKIHNNLMLTDPGYALRMQQYEASVLEYNNSPTPKVAAQYTIPVVVHVMHRGEAVGVGTNVSDANIRDAIKDLNDRYRKVQGTGGFGNGVDIGIEYALAVRDPNGVCTNGITRHSMAANSSYMSGGVKMDGNVGITETSLKAIVDWNPNKYYNIWLVSEIDNNEGGAGIQGFAYFATSHGTAIDGAIILASNFTSGVSMTATHELGHALNLYHTFEGDGSGGTCPPNSSPTTQGDKCTDTPPHKRSQSDCNVNGTNSCTGTSNALFARNYMDYASDACVNMFTADQKTRALLACSGPRASFFAASNLALVPVTAPTAAFSATNSIICAGQTVSFTDVSSCVPNTYLSETSWPGTTFSWTFTNGATVLTSTLQNPTMTFTVPGPYDVTLTVTTPAGTNTTTVNDFVILGGTQVSACTPTSANAGNFGQTVNKVIFNTINHSSDVYANAAYTNESCTYNTIVNAGQVYPISLTLTSGQLAENVEVYIDFNNNGVFANPGELVYSGSKPAAGSTPSTSTITGNVTIAASALTNTLLRMRVMGNAGAITASNRSCATAFTAGDVTDYGIYIQSACTVAPAIGTQAAAATICAGANTAFTIAATGANTYQWQVSTNSGSSWTAVTNGGVYSTATTASLTITGATAAMSTCQYRCITTNDCGTTNSAAKILTVNPSPTVSATTPSSRCGTGTVVLGATPSAGTLNWFAALTGGTSIGTGTSFTTPSISATTNYYVGATNAGCTSARTAVAATVNGNVVVTSNATGNSICAGSSVTLTATGGSSYSWSSGQTGASITVTPTATTTYTVTGVTSCTATANLIVTVKPMPNTTLSSFANVCNYNPAFSLTGGSPAGGTYSGTGVNGSGIFNPTTAGVGTATITYTVTQNGCTKAATSQIMVGACLGIEDATTDDLIILYPNPVEGWMTIEGDNLINYERIELRDATGRLVSNWVVNQTKMNIDLSQFAAGQYTVAITGTSKQTVKKIQILK